MNKVEQTESVLKTILHENILSPRQLINAVYNIFVHGEALIDLGYNFSEENLDKLMDGLETSLKAITDIEHEN